MDTSWMTDGVREEHNPKGEEKKGCYNMNANREVVNVKMK